MLMALIGLFKIAVCYSTRVVTEVEFGRSVNKNLTNLFLSHFDCAVRIIIYTYIRVFSFNAIYLNLFNLFSAI